MKIEWTEAQKKIINYENGSMLVSASAGSGKTTVMLERVMRLIREGYTLRRMLISTFTVAAADDMRDKLFELLNEEYENTKDKRYLDELDSLSAADIGTLHSWCQKLIRKYFYVTGDDPSFDIADESECNVWKNIAVTRAIEEAEADPDSGYVELSKLYNRRRNDGKVRAMTEKIMTFAQSQSDADEWLNNAANGYENNEELLTYLKNEGDKKLKKALAALDEFCMMSASYSLREKATQYEAEARSRLAYAENGDYSALGSWQRAVGITPIKEAFDRVRSLTDDYGAFVTLCRISRDDAAGSNAKTLLSLAKRATELYSEIKREKGKMDFNDLERRAKIILLSEEAKNIRESYSHVFIDEYQDINPLQESIIDLVGNDNLFFVGDIKQSIYAFRDCTPEAFAEKRDRLSEKGSLVELNKNYRSRDGILAFCNRLFSRIMTKEFGGVDYDKSARFPLETTGNDGSVEIYSFHREKSDNSKSYFDEIYSVKNHVREERATTGGNEADIITDRIVSLLKNTKYTYGDIVILVRTRAGVGRLVNNLRALGIPVSVSSKLKVESGRCNGYLLSWLRVIDNFCDDISLAAVMRSPSVGFTDAELMRIRAAHPKEEFFYDCLAAENDEKTRNFLQTVSRYTAMSKYLSPGELAGTITSEQKLFATALSEKQGIAKADGLGLLMESLSSFGGTLSEYLQMLDDAEPEVDIPPQPGSVRIMTMHGSKGLEFPVVLTYNLARHIKTDKTASYLTDGRFGLGLESRIAESGETFPSLPLIAARLRKTAAQIEEEMRILYVALTRAREKLIIFLPDNLKEKAPDEANSFADWIYPTAVSHGIMTAGSEARETKRNAGGCTPESTEEIIRSMQSLPKPEIHEIKKSVTDLLTEEYEYEDVSPVLISDYDEGDKQSAMLRGTAYHAALERLDFTKPFDEQLAALEKGENFDLVDTEKLRKAHAALTRETDGAEVYREQPFIFASDKATNGESDGMILQGVIDLLVIKNGEGEIVDYKTGALTESRKLKYNRQLDIYAAAVEKVLHIPVKSKRIFLIEQGEFMKD